MNRFLGSVMDWYFKIFFWHKKFKRQWGYRDKDFVVYIVRIKNIWKDPMNL